MVTASILFLICYLYFLINHFVLNVTSLSTAPLALCKYMTPCILLYSNFQAAEAETLTFSFLAGVLVVFYYSLRKTINYEKGKFERDLYRNFESPLAKSLFNFWWWNIDTELNSSEEIERLKNKFRLRIEENLKK